MGSSVARAAGSHHQPHLLEYTCAQAFASTMEALGLEEAFPDMQPRIYDVR